MTNLKALLAIILMALSQFGLADDFLFGPQVPWGQKVNSNINGQEISFRVGARLQGIASITEDKETGLKERTKASDMYMRRVRFQFESTFLKDFRYYTDLRNDNANQLDKGEGSFSVGDAYLEKKNLFNAKNLSIRLFRAKVDVARVETIGSSEVISQDRPFVADEAAQFVSHNRRATNIQLLGTYEKFSFQAVIGDGISKGATHDAKGNTLSSNGEISRQNFMLGAKVRFYPFAGWEDKKLAEVYFGEGKHISIGAGLFNTSAIRFKFNNGTNFNTSRTLENYEFSWHYKYLSFQSEYFKFNNVIESFSATSLVKGNGSGWYAQAALTLPNLSNLTPFVRYESWDKLNNHTGYGFHSELIGLNWYLRGTSAMVGMHLQHDDFGINIRKKGVNGNSVEETNKLKLVTAWHF